MTLKGGGAARTSLAAGDGEGCWRVVPAPAGPQAGELSDLAVGPEGDLWAVGGSYGSYYLLHMDGAQWTSLPGPTFTNTVTQTYILHALKVFSPTDIWLAGGINHSTGNPVTDSTTELVTHWDGAAWTVVLSGTVGGAINALDGVASDDLWAVGNVRQTQVGSQPIIMHWNGAQWADYTPPDVGSNLLHDVVALATDDVWMVGDSVWHWDGIALSQDATQRGLSIFALGADDIWTVDSRSTGGTSAHWDGAGWREVAVPGPGRLVQLGSVAALGADDVWAVGSYDGQALITHWNGTGWTAMPNPVAGFSSSLDEIVVANGALWSLGSRGLSPEEEMQSKVLLRYSGTGCESSGPQTPLNPPAPVPGEGRQEFITGKSTSGVFLNYWLNNGGVLQQGYPISDPIGEQSELNGQIYTVQYFERAVFEYHPELKGTAYEVLLSQLGTFQYRKKYPEGAPNQRPNTDAGTVLFAETGKRLGGRFLSYWEEHGGVQQNGYPISDEFTEVSDLDGKPYTVQYFERAVFEWHPENAQPYDVLLSQLGTYGWRDKYEKKQVAGNVPRKIAGSVLLGELAGAGHFLVWPDVRDGGYSEETIYAYNAQQNTQQPISPPLTAPDGLPLETNGKVALWNRRDTELQYLEGYDLEHHGEYKVDPPAQMDFRRVLSFGLDVGSLYYLRSNFTANMGLYGHSLATGAEQKLADPQNAIAGMRAADGSVLWVEEAGTGAGAPMERSLHLAQVDGRGQQVTIVDGIGGFTGYGVSGENVVYSFFTEISNQTTYLYNITTGSRKVITLGRASDPVINGGRVAWVRWPDPAQGEANGWSIEVYDIASGKTSTAVGNLPAMPHDLVLLDDGMIAYTADVDMEMPGYDLFVVDGVK
jgi:hypothetical protein